LTRGETKQCYFEDLVAKFQKKGAGWKAKLLSPGGRLTLVRHVLSGIPIHTMAVFDVPLGVLHRLDSIMANFLWGSSEEAKRRHWVAWDKITQPYEEGGLGIRKLTEVMLFLRMKMAWRLQQGGSLWA